MKNLIQNKYFQICFSFLFGAIIVYYFFPKKEIQYKTEIVKEFIENKNEKKTKFVFNPGSSIPGVAILPNGGTVEISETNFQKKQIEIEKKEEKKITKIKNNKFSIYGAVDSFNHSEWLVGLSWNIIGPLEVHGIYNSGFFIGAGVRF
jgi:hypothetical protein